VREALGLPDDITPDTFRKSCAAERSTTRPPRSSTPGRTQCSFEPFAYAATAHDSSLAREYDHTRILFNLYAAR